jgi:hypothetical protein
MLRQDKVIIAQRRIPDETTETTQVKALLDGVDLRNAVVTADAANAQRETAHYIAAPEEDGGRDSDYFLLVKGNQPSLQKAIFAAIQENGPRAPDRSELDHGHGRIIRRSVWVTDAAVIDFPRASQVARIRRDRYDLDGTLISKEIVHAVTSPPAKRATPRGVVVDLYVVSGAAMTFAFDFRRATGGLPATWTWPAAVSRSFPLP